MNILYGIMKDDTLYEDMDECLGDDQRILHLSYASAFDRLQYLAKAGLKDLWIQEFVPR